MRALLIFPPQWSINGLPAGLSVISGALKKFKHQSKVSDYNIEFYNAILNKTFINECLKKVEISENELIKQIYEQKKEHYLKYISKTDYFINVFRDEKLFYDIKKLSVAYYSLQVFLEIISLAYYPFCINLFNYYKVDERYNYDKTKEYAQNNIFSKFYQSKLKEIKEYNPDYIGISISSESQFISSLTLAHILKSNNIKAKIVFGGQYTDRIKEHIKNDTILFEEYIDAVIVGLGERATNEYLEYLCGKRKIEDVTNLIFMKDKKIIENNVSDKTYAEPSFVDYSNYDYKQHYLPEGVLLLKTSSGCYYNKCSFCAHNSDSVYQQRSPNEVISEIKEIIKEKNINKFFITDNSLYPPFADEFSRKIIEQKIEIYYSCDMRLEKSFDEKLLKQLYDSGLRVSYWGLESANNRVLKFLDKGITIEQSKKILETAHKIGIFNFVYFMLGIATETEKEMNDTINFMSNNSDIIDACLYNEFNIFKGSLLYKYPERYGLNRNDVFIDKDYDICPSILRKIKLSIKEIIKQGNMVYNNYNRQYNKLFKYGTNELILLYKSKNVI